MVLNNLLRTPAVLLENKTNSQAHKPVPSFGPEQPMGQMSSNARPRIYCRSVAIHVLGP